MITRRADGTRHLVGIEVKYTEHFNRTIYNSDGYRQVHEYSGWFHPGTARPLLGPATNQGSGGPASSQRPARSAG